MLEAGRVQAHQNASQARSSVSDSACAAGSVGAEVDRVHNFRGIKMTNEEIITDLTIKLEALETREQDALDLMGATEFEDITEPLKLLREALGMPKYGHVDGKVPNKETMIQAAERIQAEVGEREDFDKLIGERDEIIDDLTTALEAAVADRTALLKHASLTDFEWSTKGGVHPAELEV